MGLADLAQKPDGRAGRQSKSDEAGPKPYSVPGAEKSAPSAELRATLDLISQKLRAEPAPARPEPAAGQGASLALEEGLAATSLAFEDYRAVIRHCSRIVQISPDHFAAWFNLGYARQKVGELQESVFAYHQASRLRPDDARPLVNLGMVKQATEEWEGAREAYLCALSIDPDHPVALWNLGLICEQNGPKEEAEALFTRLVAIQPDQEEAWFRIGMICLAREDWEGSLAAFETCLRRRQPWKEASLNRGYALRELDRPAEARQCYEQVLTSEPRCVEALSGLAAVAVDQGDWETAVAARKKLVELKSAVPELTYNIGVMLDRQNRLDEAVRLYCEALKERPRFPEVLLNLGHALERLGRQAEAVECWRRALDLNPAYAIDYFQE